MLYLNPGFKNNQIQAERKENPAIQWLDKCWSARATTVDFFRLWL